MSSAEPTRAPDQAAVLEQTEHQSGDRYGAGRGLGGPHGLAQGPSAETGEALASALDHLNSVVQPHLDDEEQKVVPLAAVTLTQKEWDALGEHSRAQNPRDKKAVASGMLLEPLGPRTAPT